MDEIRKIGECLVEILIVGGMAFIVVGALLRGAEKIGRKWRGEE